MEINRKNSKCWSRLGPRATYGLAMLDLIKRKSNIYALSADLGGSSGLGRLMEQYPDHYLNVGIAEQNLLGVAAGLAKEGLIPFASSFAPFITHRCADQIRMNMGYMHLNIKTVGLGSGISMGVLGNSHYGADDLAFLRSIPGMTILSPCDCAELVMCLEAASEYEGPVYIRMTGEPGMPQVYEEDFEFKIGQYNKVKDGEDVLLIATGSMVYQAVEAANILDEKGISATVVDVYTIKPFDITVFDEIKDTCKLVVTIEEHNIISGLGAEINRHMAARMNVPPVLNIGLPDEYYKAGSYDFMLENYELKPEKIAKRVVEKWGF